ncbi:MAG: cytochrome c, partial [Rhodospirillaceae bacterium]|nr:cytochrome c [Rhodospirillaceae bacterium]
MNSLKVAFATAALLASLQSSAQVPEDGLTSRELGVRLEVPMSRTELLERGEAVYEYWCNTCHGPEMLKPGTAALAIKYRGELPAALTERTDMV